MTLVVNRRLRSSDKPVHVLVIVVGEYLSFDDLPGAGAFAEDVAAFWRAPRIFPDRQQLATIAVLASEPGLTVSISDDSGRLNGVARPTFAGCKDALLEWADRIRDTDGVGVLHWIGHGCERAGGGGVVTLYVHGARALQPSAQEGLDWTRALYVINQMTDGLPVYCFIDACRMDDRSPVMFEGIGTCDARFCDNALVFQSSRPGMPSFWLDKPTQAVRNAGCPGQAVATRAFMEALAHYGAQFAGDAARHPILAAELVQGSSALVRRWLAHQNITGGGTTGPGRGCDAPILLTEAPRSVVKVEKVAPHGSSSCSARASVSAATKNSETSSVPFEFRLDREQHLFVFDVGAASGPQPIIYPWVPL